MWGLAFRLALRHPQKQIKHPVQHENSNNSLENSEFGFWQITFPTGEDDSISQQGENCRFELRVSVSVQKYYGLRLQPHRQVVLNRTDRCDDLATWRRYWQPLHTSPEEVREKQRSWINRIHFEVSLGIFVIIIIFDEINTF